MEGPNRRIIVVDRSEDAKNDHGAIEVLEGRDEVRLRCNSKRSLDLELYLSNYYSRELLNRKVRIDPKEDIPMDLSEHREGIYLLRMGFPDGLQDERMIIKIDR